jgi:hypothetical protein
MRILIIMPDYYPKQNPRVFRWQSLAEYWAKKGWDITVLCSLHSEHNSSTNVNGVQIERVGNASMMDAIYNFFHFKKRRREAKSNGDNILSKGPLKSILSFFHKIWAFYYWPDGACIWIKPAQKKAKSLYENKIPDVVISVSLPFSSHLVGAYCKQLWPLSKWVVDIGDPFSILDRFPKNNLLLFQQKNYRSESKVLSMADAVSVTVEGAKMAYCNFFREAINKVTVISPLLSTIEKNDLTTNFSFDKSNINIAYFGSFYTGIRTPEAAVNLLGQLLDLIWNKNVQIHFHFFGYIEVEFFDVFSKVISRSKYFHLHGQVDKCDIPYLMNECDFLLNIGNKTDFQLPSKSVDYLSSGKPIINICFHKKDTFAQFFQDYPLMHNIYYLDNVGFERTEIRDLLQFLFAQKGKQVDGEWLMNKKEKYEIQAIAEKYENLFK